VIRLARWGVGAAALAVGLAAAPAGAEPVDESGYWWRFQAVSGGPLAPSGVSEGQLHVAADAVGTAAVAAVRAAVDGEVDALVLVEAASSGAPDLRACPTSGWTAPEGAGAYGERPSDEQCASASVAGVRTDGTWTFAVGGFVVDGVLDVLIVPGTEAQSVTFEAPGDGAVVVPAAPPPTTTSARPPVAAQPATGGVALPPVTAPAPSSGLAAPPVGEPVSSFERDVDAFPAPARVPDPAGGDGSRAPLALVAVVIPAAAWAYRARAALRAAPDHALAQPLRHRRDVLASVGAAVAAEPDADRGGAA
jgi:hypothetical protein